MCTQKLEEAQRQGFDQEIEWDNSKHGKGTKVRRKSDGRCGVSTRDCDGDGDIKIKFDDGGSESGWIKTRDVLVVSAKQMATPDTTGRAPLALRGHRAPAAWPPLVAAALDAPTAVVERLRAFYSLYEQMASQTPERLEGVAKALGATAEQIEGLCKVDDTRNATIELVLSLRGELEEMRLGPLRKRQKSLGASAAQLDSLDDAEDPQASATELAVALAMSLARRQEQEQEDEKTAKIAQLEKVVKDMQGKDAKIAQLEATIREMREKIAQLEATVKDHEEEQRLRAAKKETRRAARQSDDDGESDDDPFAAMVALETLLGDDSDAAMVALLGDDSD